jgi:hypothetical protein
MKIVGIGYINQQHAGHLPSPAAGLDTVLLPL